MQLNRSLNPCHHQQLSQRLTNQLLFQSKLNANSQFFKVQQKHDVTNHRSRGESLMQLIMLLFALLPFWGRNDGNATAWAEQQVSDVASSTFTSPLNSQWTSLFSSPPHGLTHTHFSFRIYWSVFPPAAAMNKSQECDREAVVAGRQRRTEREEEEEEEEALCWLSTGPFEMVSEHLVAITAAVSVGWNDEKT